LAIYPPSDKLKKAGAQGTFYDSLLSINGEALGDPAKFKQAVNKIYKTESSSSFYFMVNS
jgi:hypothetical protein